jgi:hypothetical protein
VAISGTRLFGGRSARHLAQSAREKHELDLVPAKKGNHDGNQAQSRAQHEFDLIPSTIRGNHDGNQAPSDGAI